MKATRIVEPSRFSDAFQKVGWTVELSKSKKYFICTDVDNAEVWTRLPVDTKDPGYLAYQEKNILFLLYALGLPEDEESKIEILSQLEAYNYKLMNRVIGATSDSIDTIPYELATEVTKKNIEAFRHFAQTKRDKKRVFPIDRFEFNHTEVGSFVIPVSLLAEEEPNTTLVARQSDTSIILHEYLNALDNLMKAPRSTPEAFAERAMADSIDSKIVRDFLAKDGGIAKYSDKYKKRIKGVVIGGKSSPILDYKLDSEAKSFKEIEIVGVTPVDDEYIKTLEELEIKSDSSKIDETRAKIDVIVDAIDRNGKARFTVTAINGQELKKVFKAMTSELSMTRLQECAAYFAKDGHLTVQGDIKKSKGRLGKIWVDGFVAADENRLDLSL